MTGLGARKYTSELTRIEARMATIERELRDKRSMLQYLNELAGELPDAPPPPPGAPAPLYGRKIKIEDAIVAALDGGRKLSTPELIEAIGQLGVAAKNTSIHSAISGMRKRGVIVAHDHQGRGNAYTLSGSAS